MSQDTRVPRDEVFLQMAEVVAQRSTCLRRQVGCVLVDRHGQVAATGYNGVARGRPHCNELGSLRHVDLSVEAIHPYACEGARAASGTNLDACEAIHAEQNALLQCRDIHELDTIYVTVSPCVTCTKLLLNTTCKRIVFREEYAHDAQASMLWLRDGRSWIKLPSREVR